ncbi:MAG TPA: formate--tetrahydrofolate ligase, partial [Variovorax sp.]|nr:formate--tetrahydrofolate ligase [Variovorax sp.]
IEIANAAVLRPIRDIARETLGIDEEHLVPYGHHKAKVDVGYLASLADRLEHQQPGHPAQAVHGPARAPT